MAHGQVSLDGTSHPLPHPFCVVATQNPTDLSGTYPLPDSQLDRFVMRLSLGHPTPEVEAEILRTRGAREPIRSLPPASSPPEIVPLQDPAPDVPSHPALPDSPLRPA